MVKRLAVLVTMLVTVSAGVAGADPAAADHLTCGGGCPAFNETEVVVAEGSTLVFGVTATAPPSPNLRLRTRAGTATAGADYRAVDQRMKFFAWGPPLSSWDAWFPVEVAADARHEPDETFTLEVYDRVHGIVLSRMVVTIADTSFPSRAYVLEASVEEGDTGSTVLAFQVVLNRPSTHVQSVRYRTKSGTARSELGDYTGMTDRAVFEPYVTSVTVRVRVYGDTRIEPDERLVMLLSEPSPGLSLGHAGATGWIINDDY